jgi:hypothetical protein
MGHPFGFHGFTQPGPRSEFGRVMGESETGLTVSFLNFLYPVVARTRPLAGPGLPTDLLRNSLR